MKIIETLIERGCNPFIKNNVRIIFIIIIIIIIIYIKIYNYNKYNNYYLLIN